MPHVKLYKLSWISNEGEIDVNIQVLINFSVGSYKDEVRDVVRRPWQFDKQTLHNGHTNQYIFCINGNKTTLLPLSTIVRVFLPVE